jgi:hypothetical protein
MDRCEVPQINITIALHTGLYLAIKMGQYEGPHTALNIALHRWLYLAITMDRYEGPQLHLLLHCIEAST